MRFQRNYRVCELLLILMAAQLLVACASSPYGLLSVNRASQPYLAEQSLPSLQSDEELWVIARPSVNDQGNFDDRPGSGAMLSKGSEGSFRPLAALPLKHTDVNARISGYVGSVDVTQRFHNPFNEKIEAIYLFPLPQNAAVNEFVMTIGERRIRGILREKKEAQEIYHQARAQGYRASLLVQHRPNFFQQRVANIEPGQSIDVDIRYIHTLQYEDGWYSFVFPTVVGPRFNPVFDSDKADPKNVRNLRPKERSAHDISINVELDAGVAIEELKASHPIVTSTDEPSTARVRLANGSTIPNRDFILKYRVAGQKIKSSLLTHIDPRDGQGYFTLMLYPPEDWRAMKRAALEMVFVIDASGSMSGVPMEQVKLAVGRALDRLEAQDSFQIIRFSDNSSSFGAKPIPATAANIAKARKYLARLNGDGGTQMIEGVKAALDFPHDRSRLRFVTFLTDGYIGNEPDILAAVQQKIGASRIFSFGVGSSVNRFLLERLASEGRGVAAYLGPNDAADVVMDRFFDRISHPAMTDLQMDWGAMAVSDVYPQRIPDMFSGRPVLLTGKYTGVSDELRILGYAGETKVSTRVPVSAQLLTVEPRPEIATLWARLRIKELKNRQYMAGNQSEELADSILQTALHHQLLSDYTSFVAVDASARTDGDHGTEVPQRLPVPQGVRYDTTVNEK